MTNETVDGRGRRKIGESVLRKEDDRYIRGHGQFSDDLNKPNQCYAVFVRSIFAHAHIKNINVESAVNSPGVIAVYTGQDFKDDGCGPILHKAIEANPVDYRKPSFDENDPVALSLNQWPLPIERVRHIGEPVAVVIGESIEVALQGAEMVELELAEIKAVVDVFQAAAPYAPLVDEDAPGNVCIHHFGGDADKTKQALDKAATVVDGEFVVPRVATGQMEPRSGIAEYDAESDRYIVTAGCQGVFRFRLMLAGALQVEIDKVRVICPDTGGGFGSRGHTGPECVILPWVAKKLGRPIKWTNSRSESFVSDWQGRDMVLKGRLGLDADGKFTGYDLLVQCNIGAYTICYAPPANATRIVTTVYDIPAAKLEIRAYMTNTLPVLPYRAAGRPEMTYALERLIDLAAQKAGIDRYELRRINLVTADDMPFTNPVGMTYDVGDFPRALDVAADLVDWRGFEERRHEAKSRGMLRGISIVPFVETPVGAPFESARLEITSDGTATIFAGTQAHGQGHETTYAQVVSDLLGVPFENISLAQGDSDALPIGGGTHSDRSMRMIGTLLHQISGEIIEISTPVAAELLQSEPDQISFTDGRFRVTDSDQEVDFMDVAAAYCEFQGNGGVLKADARMEGRIKAFPYGASAAEMEIDPETGEMTIQKYCLVDDCGQPVNPMIVHGQVHGGIVQGAGQAIGELAYYDLNSGQMLAGSFMDYMMPRADQFPFFKVDSFDVPTKGNPLSVKAGGEAGTVPALAVVGNAVMDALSDMLTARRMDHFDMPFTAARIWQEVLSR